MKLIEYISQGGPVMYILLVLNIIGLATMLTKFITLAKERKQTDQMVDELKDKINGMTSEGTHDASTVIELCKQEISEIMTKMEGGLSTIKIIASISPLLGLLGTVIGVLIAFRVMSETGLNNPASFAQGISMALITTVGGLIVAIPHYIGHNYLLKMLDTIEVKLEKKLISKLL